MYTVQFMVNGECVAREFNSRSRSVLVYHLAKSEHPIVAVFEQVTVVTKIIRRLMTEYRGKKSKAARDFANQLPPAAFANSSSIVNGA